MNEQIKQLAEQAWKEVLSETSIDGDTSNVYSPDEVVAFEQKFAELIIKECLAKAEEEEELYRGFSHLGGAEYAKVMYNYQLLLKEHFGVEE